LAATSYVHDWHAKLRGTAVPTTMRDLLLIDVTVRVAVDKIVN